MYPWSVSFPLDGRFVVSNELVAKIKFGTRYGTVVKRVIPGDYVILQSFFAREVDYDTNAVKNYFLIFVDSFDESIPMFSHIPSSNEMKNVNNIVFVEIKSLVDCASDTFMCKSSISIKRAWAFLDPSIPLPSVDQINANGNQAVPTKSSNHNSPSRPNQPGKQRPTKQPVV
jgi:hypothetical protein